MERLRGNAARPQSGTQATAARPERNEKRASPRGNERTLPFDIRPPRIREACVSSDGRPAELENVSTQSPAQPPPPFGCRRRAMNLLDVLGDRNTTVLPAGNVLLFRCSRVSRRQSIFNKTGRGRWFKQIRFSKGCGIRNQFVRVYETGLDADWRYGVLFFKAPVVGTEQVFYKAGAPLVRPHQREDSNNMSDEPPWNLAHTTFDCGDSVHSTRGALTDDGLALDVANGCFDALKGSEKLETSEALSIPSPADAAKELKDEALVSVPVIEWHWLSSPGEDMPVKWCKSTKTLIFDREAAACNGWSAMRGSGAELVHYFRGELMVDEENCQAPRLTSLKVDPAGPAKKRIKLETVQEPLKDVTPVTDLAVAHPSKKVMHNEHDNETGASLCGAVPPQPTAGELLYLAGAHPAGPELDAGPMPHSAGMSLNVQHPAVQAGIHAAQAAHHVQDWRVSLPCVPHHFQAPPPHPGMMMPHPMGQYPYEHAGHYMPPFPGMYPGHAVSWAYPPPPPQHLHWHPGSLHEAPVMSSIAMLPPVDMIQAGAAMPFVPDAPQLLQLGVPPRDPAAVIVQPRSADHFSVDMLLQGPPAH